MKSNEKFTQRAELAIERAREAAGELGHSYVGTEHLLLGVLRENDCQGCRILLSAGVEPQKLYDMTLRFSDGERRVRQEDTSGGNEKEADL